MRSEEKLEAAIAAVEALGEGFVETDLNPTEDAELVKKAVLNIFPGAKLEAKDGKISGKTELSAFKEQLAKEKIRSTVCELLDRNCTGGESFVDLHKMAAVAGKVAIDEDFPLGKIRLKVSWKRLRT